MIHLFRMLGRARSPVLVILPFLFLACGCKNEAVVVIIPYEMPASNEGFANGSYPNEPSATGRQTEKDGGLRPDATLYIEQADNNPENSTAPHDGFRIQTSKIPSLTHNPSATPALTQTPFLSPTPTLRPTPTLTPRPTIKPTPSPTTSPRPSATPAVDTSQAVAEEIRRYEDAVRRIHQELEGLLQSHRDMLNNLRLRQAQNPEYADEIQAEIEGVQAAMDALERDFAARLEAEHKDHMDMLAKLGKY